MLLKALWFLLVRAAVALLIVLLVSLVTFVAVDYTVDAQETIEGDWISLQFHQTKAPVISRYGEWLGDVVRGDWRDSFIWNRSVSEVIASHFKVTFLIGIFSFSSAFILSFLFLVLLRTYANTLLERCIRLFCLVLHSAPAFIASLLLIWIFSLQLGWFPTSGTSEWSGYVLPSLALALALTPRIVFVLDRHVQQILQSPFILQLRCCGVHGPTLWLRHVLVNLVPPLLGVANIQLVHIFTGAVITESVFSINGLGRLTVQSVISGDMNMVLAISVLFAAFAVLADLMISFILFITFPSGTGSEQYRQ